jgi:cysteine rich repeat protein
MTIRAALTALLMWGAAAPAHAQVTAEQQSAIRSNCRSDFMSKCSGVTPGGKEALECLQKNVGGLSAACKTAVSSTLPKPATASAPAQSPWPAPANSQPSSPWPAPAASTQPAAPAAPATASAPPPAKPAAPTAAAPKAPGKPKAAAAAKPAAPKAKTAAVPPPAVAAPAITPTPEQAAAIKFTCSHDVKSYCADAAAGGPEGFACLQRNSEKLSPDCRTSVAAVEENAAVEETEQPTAPAAGSMPKAPAANAVVTLRACKRDIVKHCKDVQPGGGRELACLAAHENDLTVRCKMARRVSAPIR